MLIEWGQEPLPFIKKYSVNSNIKDVVTQIKETLKLKNNWAESLNSWSNAFSYLIDRAEQAGIFVVINGVVGNNPHRELNINEFRGFVLCDEIAPFVFINNKDFISAKIFTLIHEIVHLFIGKSASFDLRGLQSADNETEKFCDLCSAEFLVPSSKIENIKEINFEDLARRFKVSQIVIARRLLDTGKINREDFLQFYNEYTHKEYKSIKSQGGDFYNTIIRRYGKRFLEIIGVGVESGSISYRDAYRLIGVKPSTFDRLKQEVLPH